MTAGDDDREGDLEPYCATCGATIGIFIGHGEDWHHFRGSGTVADPSELYESGHEPVVAWRDPARTEADRQEAIAASWHQRQAERRSDLEGPGPVYYTRRGDKRW